MKIRIQIGNEKVYTLEEIMEKLGYHPEDDYLLGDVDVDMDSQEDYVPSVSLILEGDDGTLVAKANTNTDTPSIEVTGKQFDSNLKLSTSELPNFDHPDFETRLYAGDTCSETSNWLAMANTAIRENNDKSKHVVFINENVAAPTAYTKVKKTHAYKNSNRFIGEFAGTEKQFHQYSITKKGEPTPKYVCSLLIASKRTRTRYEYDESTNVIHSKGTEEIRYLSKLMKWLSLNGVGRYNVIDKTDDTVWTYIGTENTGWPNAYWAILSAKLHLDSTGDIISRFIGGIPDHKLTREELDKILTAKNNRMPNNEKAMLFNELFH